MSVSSTIQLYVPLWLCIYGGTVAEKGDAEATSQVQASHEMADNDVLALQHGNIITWHPR